jgi:hypothetical protein
VGVGQVGVGQVGVGQVGVGQVAVGQVTRIPNFLAHFLSLLQTILIVLLI